MLTFKSNSTLCHDLSCSVVTLYVVAVCSQQVTGVCLLCTASQQLWVLPDQEPTPQPGSGLIPRRLGRLAKRLSNQCRETWITSSDNHFDMSMCTSCLRRRYLLQDRGRGSVFGRGMARTSCRLLLNGAPSTALATRTKDACTGAP